MLPHLNLPTFKPYNHQTLSIAIHILFTAAYGRHLGFILALPLLLLEHVYTICSIRQSIPKTIARYPRNLNNLGLLRNILYHLFTLENSESEVIRACNQLIHLVIVEVEEFKSLNVVTADGPETFFAINVEACDVAVTADDDEGLAHFGEEVAWADTDGRETIVYFFVENVRVVCAVIN